MLTEEAHGSAVFIEQYQRCQPVNSSAVWRVPNISTDITGPPPGSGSGSNRELMKELWCPATCISFSPALLCGTRGPRYSFHALNEKLEAFRKDSPGDAFEYYRGKGGSATLFPSPTPKPRVLNVCVCVRGVQHILRTTAFFHLSGHSQSVLQEESRTLVRAPHRNNQLRYHMCHVKPPLSSKDSKLTQTKKYI